MSGNLPLWFVRVGWASLPVTLGAQLADMATNYSDAVRLAMFVMAWLVWGAGLTASLLTLPWGLLILRCATPLSLLAAVFAAVDHSPSTLGWAGLVTAVLVTVVSMSAEVGDVFINGAAYGDERRFALRVPAVLMLGPVPAAWVVAMLPTPGAVLALAAGRTRLGVVLALIAVPGAWWGVRSLYQLTRRWCVLVPAGITVVDHMALAEPTLVRREDIAWLGPAPVDSGALDLSVGATGLICEVRTKEPVTVHPAVGRGGVSEGVSTTGLLIAVARPGAMLNAAAERRINVARGTRT